MYHVLRNLKHWIHMCFLCGHTSTSLDTARFLYASFIPYAKVPGFQDSSKALRHTDFFLFYIWKRLIQRNNESLRQWLVYSQGQYTDWACVWKTKLNNPKLSATPPSTTITISDCKPRLQKVKARRQTGQRSRDTKSKDTLGRDMKLSTSSVRFSNKLPHRLRPLRREKILLAFSFFSSTEAHIF